MTGVSRVGDLTIAERMRVYRRRRGMSRAEMGHDLRRSRHWVGDVERGAKEPPLAEVPWIGPKELSGPERCMLYRLRSGTTQAHIASELGVSRLWVNKMERGLAPCDDLIWYWEC